MATIYRVKGVRQGQGEQIGGDLTDRASAEKLFERALASGRFDDLALGEGTPKPDEPAKFDWTTIRRADRKSAAAAPRSPSPAQPATVRPASGMHQGGTSPMMRYVAIGAGIVVIAAIGAGVFVMRSSAPPPVAPSAQAPSPAPTIVQTVNRSFAVPATVDVRQAPSASAPILLTLRDGDTAMVTGIVEGNDWLQLALPDQRPGYVPTVAIPAAAPGGMPTPPAPAEVSVTEFRQSTEILATAAASAAFVAPNADAPKMYPLEVGTPVQTIEKSKDAQWVVVVTEDGQAAFLPTADLGPYMPPKRDDNAPDEVSGPGKVIDTANLVVGTQRLSIAGITGESGTYASQLQALINSQGPTIRCARLDEKYVCKLPNGGDIARLALFNGAARAGPDANADYQQQAAAAQTAHRGVWK